MQSEGSPSIASEIGYSMIDDLDILRAAKLMIDRHGDGACSRATRRADDLEEVGDTFGAGIWRQIVTPIDELQRGRPEGEAVN